MESRTRCDLQDNEAGNPQFLRRAGFREPSPAFRITQQPVGKPKHLGIPMTIN
jgi:hypothetical protein